MSTRGDILRRAAQVESDAVPEPWRPSDDEDALATVSDREHYRKNLVTLPDGAGEVPAYVWDFPRTPTIPNDVREGWTRGSAGRVLGPQGKYVSRGSDVPRLSYDGGDPGLLVEASGRTNHVEHSANVSNWVERNNVSVGTAVSSVIQGHSAYPVSGTTDTDAIKTDAGLSSGSEEALSLIIEENTGGVTDFEVAQDENAQGVYDWSTDTASNDFRANAVNRRVLTENGPNGGRVVVCVMRYEDSSTGNNRDLVISPRDGSVYVHHAQIEEAPNASSPIVTQGSPVTRAGDDYAIFEGGQPEWWNPNKGTLIFTIRPQVFYNDKFQDLLSTDVVQQIEYWNVNDLTRVGVNSVSKSIDQPMSGPFSRERIVYSFSDQAVRLHTETASSPNESTSGAPLNRASVLKAAGSGTPTIFQDLLYLPIQLSNSQIDRIV